jgi:uncharacterized surface protein with fasciclin (FAS1) repeats
MLPFARSAMIKATLGAAVVAGLLAATPAAHAQAVMAPAYDILASQARFYTTTTMINIAGLVDRARGPVPFTLFAPTEAAWADRSGVKGQLLAFLSVTSQHNSADVFPDTAKVIKVIRSWTVAGLHPLSEFEGKKVTLTNLNGDPIDVDGTGGQLSVTFKSTVTGQGLKANITLPPISATNAVIYPADNVDVE